MGCYSPFFFVLKKIFGYVRINILNERYFYMINEFSRTELLLGSEKLNKLKNSTVAVFGVGGVGGYVAEALARCGIGHIVLVDNDVVSLTNLNRQVIALQSTIGMQKTEVMKNRITDINPSAVVEVKNCFYLPENSGEFDFSKYDYVVDAIDTVTGKLQLVMQANECGTPIISSMGTGNKLDPTAFEVADIYKTSVCPLARVMRYELKKRGIKKLKVVYSKEKPVDIGDVKIDGGKNVGSIAFVPSVAGLIIASEVVKDLCQDS